MMSPVKTKVYQAKGSAKRIRTTKRKSNLDIITTLPTTHARHRNP
jgi:hypothetical protein